MGEILKDISNDTKDNTKAVLNVSFIKYLAEKAQALLKVSYLITNNLDSKDPLRLRIRERSFELHDKGQELLRIPSYGSAGVAAVIDLVDELLLGVDLLVAAGYLSQANATFLAREYRTVRSVCEEVAVSPFTELLELPEPRPSSQAAAASGVTQVRRAPLSQARRSTLTQKPSSDGGSASARREQILARILPGAECSIRHIVEGVPGVSEKTIQRELAAMVLEGILLKKGERRWSMYTRARST